MARSQGFGVSGAFARPWDVDRPRSFSEPRARAVCGGLPHCGAEPKSCSWTGNSVSTVPLDVVRDLPVGKVTALFLRAQEMDCLAPLGTSFQLRASSLLYQSALSILTSLWGILAPVTNRRQEAESYLPKTKQPAEMASLCLGPCQDLCGRLTLLCSPPQATGPHPL